MNSPELVGVGNAPDHVERIDRFWGGCGGHIRAMLHGVIGKYVKAGPLLARDYSSGGRVGHSARNFSIPFKTGKVYRAIYTGTARIIHNNCIDSDVQRWSSTEILDDKTNVGMDSPFINQNWFQNCCGTINPEPRTVAFYQSIVSCVSCSSGGLGGFLHLRPLVISNTRIDRHDNECENLHEKVPPLQQTPLCALGLTNVLYGRWNKRFGHTAWRVCGRFITTLAGILLWSICQHEYKDIPRGLLESPSNGGFGRGLQRFWTGFGRGPTCYVEADCFDPCYFGARWCSQCPEPE